MEQGKNNGDVAHEMGEKGKRVEREREK